jgi:class 3 adenylate cyclase
LGCNLRGVSRLDAASRAELPNSAFAYVDSQGRRRLPIHDAAHVRNALARFNQVVFENEGARDQARLRLLRAAKKYRIVPVGFIDGELRSARAAREPEEGVLLSVPSGFVTLMMTDIEGSTALVGRLGDRYGQLITDCRDLLRSSVERADGVVVEARADEFFAVFALPAAAIDAAASVQRELAQRVWVENLPVRVRIGIHSGYPTVTAGNYIGMAVHLAARICSAAHGGQIVASADTKLALKGSMPPGVRWKSLGTYALRGIPEPVALFQVVANGLVPRFPPLRDST